MMFEIYKVGPKTRWVITPVKLFLVSAIFLGANKNHSMDLFDRVFAWSNHETRRRESSNCELYQFFKMEDTGKQKADHFFFEFVHLAIHGFLGNIYTTYTFFLKKNLFICSLACANGREQWTELVVSKIPKHHREQFGATPRFGSAHRSCSLGYPCFFFSVWQKISHDGSMGQTVYFPTFVVDFLW